MQTALITGATSGIGKELALIMARAGHDLVLVSRSKSRLQQTSKLIASDYDVKVQVCAIDLSAAGSAIKLYKKLKHENIEILINNAGVGLKGDFFNDDPERTAEMIQLNMVSLTELAQLFGRDFVRQKSGRILNIASITAFIPGPNQPVYYATKAYVRSLSRALAYNVRGSGVTVTALHPGPTKTAFFSSSNASDFKGGASAKSVAELGYKAMMNGNIEVTHGVLNKLLAGVFVRLIPSRYHASIVARLSDV